MAKCKYPNEVCANMTLYHGVMYCDSVPCSLKNELPNESKRTMGDKIRAMQDDELAEFLSNAAGFSKRKWMEFLQTEVEE